MKDKSPQAQSAFELEKYKADRVHELELNKFAHAFEFERLKILQLLNGGAFTVAVGFSDALTGASGASRCLALAGIAAWVGGLIAAAWAAQLALDTQVRFSSAYHRRRRATEWYALDVLPAPPEGVKAMLGLLPVPADSETPVASWKDAAIEYSNRADQSVTEGKNLSPQVQDWAIWSVALFVIGAALTIAALAVAGETLATAPPATIVSG